MDERQRAIEQRIEKAEKAVSILIRLSVSAMLPLWALVMLAIGFKWFSPWWVATGAAVGAIGVLLLAGSSLTDPFLRDQP